MTPIILAENFASRAGVSITDPGSATGFPATRLYDARVSYHWKTDGVSTRRFEIDLGAGQSIEAGAWAVLANNLSSKGAACRPQYSDNGADWSDIEVYTPTEDRDICRTIQGAGAHRYWGLQLDGDFDDTEVQIGEAVIGRCVTLPHGLAVQGTDPSGLAVELTPTFVEAGEVAQQVVRRKGRRVKWVLHHAAGSWADSETEGTGFRWWLDNYAAAGLNSVFAWSPDGAGALEHEVIYGRVVSVTRTPFSAGAQANRRDIILDIEAGG